MHIIPHAISLFVFVQCVTVISVNFQHSQLEKRSKTQHSTLRQRSP